MRRRGKPILAAGIAAAGLALVVCAGAASPQAAACRPRAPEPGYRMLFDGTAATQAGWTMAGPGGFDLQADCTLRSRGGLGLLWYRARPLASPLTLEAEWMIPGDDNSGVFVGFPQPGNDPFVAVNHGYEIQIDATDRPEATTGAIYNFQAADQAVRDRVLNPPGHWNRYEITLDAPRIVVRLNGAVINRFVSTDPARSTLGLGFVGLQNHSDADRIFFRGVQAREWGADRPRCTHPAARPRSDAFAGTRLDGCRWNRIVRYDGGGLELAGGALHVELTDDGRPANLVLQRAPQRDWTIETAVRVPPAAGREAGLVAYRGDGDFVKLVAAAGGVRLASVSCGAAAPARSLGASGRTYRLRLRRTGSTYSGFASTDGRTWKRVGGVVDRRLGNGAAFGLLAAGPSRAGPPVYATFDRFAASVGRRAPSSSTACKR